MANDTAKGRVGIIGAGRMGLAMAKHLIKHGYALTVCDVDAGNAGARRQGAGQGGEAHQGDQSAEVDALRQKAEIHRVGATRWRVSLRSTNPTVE